MSTSTVDRESFQKALASAFAIQQRLTDGESLSTHCCDETEAATEVSIPTPGNALPSAADILDTCFPSFRVCQPEVETARLWPRDLWTPALILLIALALLLGWMIGRHSSRRFADTKGPPLVSAKPDAASAQPEENRQAAPSPPPPIPRKARSREAPSDSLIVYQDGKVIFRLNPSEKVGETIPDPFQAPGEPSAPDPALGPPGKANMRLLQRVEPEYPELARQQHIQGPVVLQANVGRDGAVQQLTVISGNSMLATAASDAVRQWRFKPLVQNSRAVQFQTRIKVNFVLP
ncbi:MAG: energy transducer TonB [Candidatus Sulfotelmatobacter sp.]